VAEELRKNHGNSQVADSIRPDEVTRYFNSPMLPAAIASWVRLRLRYQEFSWRE
jgi:hypothetical protein